MRDYTSQLYADYTISLHKASYGSLNTNQHNSMPKGILNTAHFSKHVRNIFKSKFNQPKIQWLPPEKQTKIKPKGHKGQVQREKSPFSVPFLVPFQSHGTSRFVKLLGRRAAREPCVEAVEGDRRITGVQQLLETTKKVDETTKCK